MENKKLIYNGWVNVFKGKGYTSTHVVRNIKKKFKIKKVGHYGTLDPMASGVLPIALGEATKTIQFIYSTNKTYSFSINWGKETDTCDSEGKTIREIDRKPKKHEIISEIEKNFIGTIVQKPP